MLLRRYVVLPAILLALGVGDASAMSCKVIHRPDGVNFRKGPSYKSEWLCNISYGHVFTYAQRDNLNPIFVEVAVRKKGYPSGCNDNGISEYYVQGYVAEFSGGGDQLLDCSDRRVGRRLRQR